MLALTAKDFEAEILRQWRTAEISGLADVLILAGDLHRGLGGYPGPKNRMPVCCDVMRRMMDSSVDSILSEPPKGKGASLCIRYRIPRPSIRTAGHDSQSIFISGSSTERGSAFQKTAELALGKMLRVTFQREAPVLLGDPPKMHKFDLASTDRRCVVECKNFTFTASGNVPNAKLAILLEAVHYLNLLPAVTVRILAMNRATVKGRSDSLAEYFVRVKGSFLGGVRVVEFTEDGQVRLLAGKPLDN
jgi:hypothetical protein